ncbi:MAG: DUF4041 domain-containing protein [Cyanobacteriota bacterium]|jgi:hypothetical protein
MAFIFFLLIVLLFVWIGKQQTELRKLRERLRPIIEVDYYVKSARETAEGLTREADLKCKQLNQEAEHAKKELEIIQEALALKAFDAHALEVGYNEPVYGFEDLPRYEAELIEIKKAQKAMLQLDGSEGISVAAAYAINPPGLGGLNSKQLKNILRLMIRAFNGESDSLIARANYRNIEAMKKRIQSSFDQINKLAIPWDCKIGEQYLANKQDELQLVYEYEEQKQREKQEQLLIREQIREEERAAREAEKARLQAEKDEEEYKKLLEKAKKEAASASEKDKYKLSKKIKELQQRIDEIEERKRAISQAMLTRSGYVYILSNVGSFGENIYKIGMTRRLDPMERVNELGDASVPFPFDVHALISTSDAPTLEAALHKHFGRRRINLENERKEFFRVSIDEIRSELEILKDQLGIKTALRLTLVAEAKQFRQSEAKRRYSKQT